MSSTTSCPSTGPPIGPTAIPMLLGYVMNWALFGALTVQVYLYYMAFPKDRVRIKCLVFGIYLLEVLQSSIISRDMFLEFAAGFGDPSVLGTQHLEWLAIPVLSGIVSCIVQIFFAFRIFVLSKNKFITIVVIAIALTQGISAVVQGIQALIINNFAQLQEKAFVSCIIWLAGSALCDVIIAGCMSYFLSQKDTSFKATRILLNRLVRLTVETGSLTAVIATVDIVLFLSFPHNNYHTAPATILGKLYSNTLLLILNSRIRIVGGRDVVASNDLIELGTAFTPDSIQFRVTSTRERVIDIAGRKDTWTDNTNSDTIHQPKLSHIGQEAQKEVTLDYPRESV